MVINIGSMTLDLLGGVKEGRGVLICAVNSVLLRYKSRLISLCENNSLIFYKNYQLYLILNLSIDFMFVICYA